MDHNMPRVFKGLLDGVKEIGKLAKAPAAAGASLIVAHPVAAAFTVVVIVGVGVAIYYYTQGEKENDLKYGNDGDDDDDPKGASGGYFYDPVTKSVTDTPTPVASNNIRKRHFARRASSITERNLLKTPDDKKDNLSTFEDLHTETSGYNLNTDYDKFLPDSGMSGGKKVEEFIRNILEADTGSNVDHVESYNVNEMHSVEDGNSSILSSDSISSSWSDVSSGDLGSSSIRSYSSVGTVLSGDYDMCQACDEDDRNPVNTHNEPCHHRYLCNDCARRIFKLFKRCKVCRAKIEAIVLD